VETDALLGYSTVMGKWKTLVGLFAELERDGHSNGMDWRVAKFSEQRRSSEVQAGVWFMAVERDGGKNPPNFSE
jgi:hypothetical protein